MHIAGVNFQRPQHRSFAAKAWQAKGVSQSGLSLVHSSTRYTSQHFKVGTIREPWL